MMKKVNERPSERSIYIWNITGSIANALLSVVALMIVTRILDDRQADIFSIAWTISQLMATVGTFQIRMYQATDVTGVFRFRQYLIYRMITIGIMMISSYAYVMIRGYSGEKAVVVLLMCIFRAVDSLADVYEGWFQQKERLDLSGKALTYRIVVAVLGFGVVLFTTRNLILSGAVLVVVYVVCFFVYDIRLRCRGLSGDCPKGQGRFILGCENDDRRVPAVHQCIFNDVYYECSKNGAGCCD